MKRYFLLIAVFALLLSGCVEQKYYVTVDRDGGADLRMTVDTAQLSEQLYKDSGMSRSKFTENMTARLNERCLRIQEEYEGVKCKVSFQKMIITQKLTEGMVFEKKEGIPYITYHLTVKSLPLYLLADDPIKENEIKFDLMSKENFDYLKSIEGGKGEVSLSIEMPSEIIYAKSGGINAKVNGNKAEFNLVQVADSPAEIEVTSKELNMFWIYVFVGIIAAIVLALVMKMFKKEEVKE